MVEKLCRDRHAVGAIAVEQKRRRAVELRLLAVEQGTGTVSPSRAGAMTRRVT